MKKPQDPKSSICRPQKAPFGAIDDPLSLKSNLPPHIASLHWPQQLPFGDIDELHSCKSNLPNFELKIHHYPAARVKIYRVMVNWMQFASYPFMMDKVGRFNGNSVQISYNLHRITR